MGFAKLSKIFLIIAFPFLVFISAVHLASFSDSFYKEEFSKYDVEKNIPEAFEIHKNVINFIKGKSNYLPDNFNEREKQHLLDVRSLIRIGTILMYFLVLLFVVLLAFSALALKASTYINNFVGKVLMFGGLLALGISCLILLIALADFGLAFESFHKLFFQPGTYAFNPETEIIVNLYPEALFMDLGLRIGKLVALASFIFIAVGAFILFRSKKS